MKKKKFLKACKGSISIFLSLLLTGVCSLTALVMEAGRYKVADQTLDEATITSALSALADYDSTLQKRFGLYAVKAKNGEGGNLEKYIKANSDSESSGLSSLYNLTKSDTKWKYDLANYSVLERQILEYEKYRAPLEISEELFDIDGLIKKLQENVGELLPKLNDMLDIVDSACDMLDAIKELYKLYKTIQQLQASTLNGKEGFTNTLNQTLGSGWETIESLFSGESWNTADPSYYVAYRALEAAINDKISYMNEHSPAPEKPAGNRPTVDESNKTNGEILLAYSIVLKYMYEKNYFNDEGIVDSDSKIEDLFNDSSFKTQQGKLTFLNKNMTRLELVEEMSKKLVSKGYNSIGVNSKKSEISQLYTAVNSAANSYQSNYNSQVNSQSAWDNKNSEYNTYQSKMTEYNSTIDTAKNNLSNSLSIISSELGTYKTSITKCKEAVIKASAAVNKMKASGNDLIGNGDWSEEDISKIEDVFTIMINLLTQATLDNANSGMVFIANQKTALSQLSSESVDQNFGSLSSHTNLDKGKMEWQSGGYYLNKTEMTGVIATIAGLSICKNMQSQLITVVNCFKELQQAFSVIPALFDPTCVAKLDSATTSLFPSITGTNSEGNIEEDLASISSYLNEARTFLGTLYDEDINLVDPENVSNSDLLNEELIERIARISSTMQKLSGQQDSILAKTLIIPVLIKIVSMAPEIIQLIEDIAFVASHLKEFLALLPQHLGESVLINQYAISNFSNRLDKVKGEQGIGKTLMGTSGVQANAQTFSQANVEYIVNGSYSELVNQEACYQEIFALRLINNAILILTDPDWMEIIAACNIAAPIVFLVLLYVESNMDMNLLIKLGMEIPFIKTQLILSLDTISQVTEDLSEVVQVEEFTVETDDYIYSYYSEETHTTYTYTYEEYKKLSISDSLDDSLGTIGDDAKIVLDKNESALNKYYATKEVSEETKKILKNLEKGLFKMDYKTYLFLFMLFQSNRLKVQRMADLIQMELRWEQLYQKGTGPDVLLEDYHTFVRVETEATLNSVLPVISLGKDGINKAGWKIKSTKYVGY